MDIKCIALDLDRTTLNERGRLSQENREALEYAIHKGVHVIIASGRGFDALPRDVVSVPGIEYAITSNGAAVYHVPTGKRLMAFHMTPQSVQGILTLTRELPVAYEGFVDGVAYADAAYVQDPVAHGATANAIPYIQSTRRPVADIRAFLLEHQSELECIDLVVDSETRKRQISELLLSRIPDLYITSSVQQLLEISHRNGGKHSGVRFVAEHLGLSPAQIAAFGDGDNDVEMLSYVGCGIAVKNASPAALAAADRVTKAHNENGVAYGIYQILAI